MPREKRSPGGFTRALQQMAIAGIAALYQSDTLPTDDALREAKVEAIGKARSLKAGMPLQKRIAQARRNAAALGTRKYHQV